MASRSNRKKQKQPNKPTATIKPLNLESKKTQIATDKIANKPSSGSWLGTVLSKLWNWTTAVSTLFGLFGIAAIIPRLDVNFTNSLDQKHPFKSIVEIKNSGLIPVYDVNYSVLVIDLKGGDLTIHGIDGGLELKPGLEAIPKLSGDDTYTETFPYDRLFEVKSSKNLIYTTYADIYLIFSYKLFWVFPQTKAFRFLGHKSTEGQFVWGKQPSNDALKENHTNFNRVDIIPRPFTTAP